MHTLAAAHRRHRPACGPIWPSSSLWCWRSPGYRRSGRPWWPGLPCWPAREKLDIVVLLAVALAGAEVGGLAGYAIGARSQPDASCSWPGTTVSARPAERHQAPASERPAGNHGDCLVDAADLARRFGLGGAARVSDGRSRVQSTTAPPVKLISLAVIVRAQSDAAKAAMLATSS